ncbi:MAG: pilus assembly PilX N-terminal domain-containing protein, partial [Acidobacteria bacterium]|nr:pilus assembly PilX N-terminal domain-containing protein [Acidobacteriota bacterium]
MKKSADFTHSPTKAHEETGMALILTLFALALFSALGLVMTMNATMEVRISDNSESHLRATLAAISGLNHARIVVDRLDFDALLRGPDGVYDTDAAYMKEARSFGFRLPVSVLAAQKLNIEAPLVGDAYDDGIISTGALYGVAGTVLIPREGIAQWTDNPTETGRQILSRYFV